MHTLKVDVTDEQLRAAWRCRRKSDWPATFEEAMRVPLYERIIRMEAAHGEICAQIRRRAAFDDRPEPPAEIPAARRRGWSLPFSRYRADSFDRKRAAAGERDED